MSWTIHGDGRSVSPGDVVKPGERLSWPRTIGLGGQHVVAMFGATFLVPIITGFDPSTTLLFSGLGTLLFLLLTRNRLPSYLAPRSPSSPPCWPRRTATTSRPRCSPSSRRDSPSPWSASW